MVKLALPDELYAVIQERDLRNSPFHDPKPPGYVYCFWPTFDAAVKWKESLVFGEGMKVVHVKMTTVKPPQDPPSRFPY